MKEIKNDIIKTFMYNDYEIYIKDTLYTYELYIQNINYGVISLMVGLPKENYTLEQVIELLGFNLEEEIETYKELYEDKD